MRVQRMNRQSERFYEYMGPVFGSRIVQRETHDRFFDDPDKEWFFVQGHGAASVAKNVIKNFWAADEETAKALIACLQGNYRHLRGIVPATHESVFERTGFITKKYKKNFIEVCYERD